MGVYRAKKKPISSATLTTYVDEETFIILQKGAMSDNRSLSSHVAIILKHYAQGLRQVNQKEGS